MADPSTNGAPTVPEDHNPPSQPEPNATQNSSYQHPPVSFTRAVPLGQNDSKAAEAAKQASRTKRDEHPEKKEEDTNKAELVSYALEAHQKNTVDHPSREATAIVPILIRRVDSVELLPKPFRSSNQIIAFSYISIIFCCCIASAATHFSMRAKVQRDRGAYVPARLNFKRACLLSVLAVVTGCCIVALVMILEFAV